jgi:PAS domain S-box-containing protein
LAEVARLRAAPSVDAAPQLEAVERAVEDALITTDIDDVITSWNRGAERLYGYRDEDVLGRPVDIIIPPHSLNAERETLARIRAGESIHDRDAVGRHRDGRDLPVALTITPVFAFGRVVGAVRVARDLSERQQADRAVRRLAAIVQSSDDAIIGKDLNGIVTSWNRSAEQLIGYTSDEMIGKSIRTIIPADRQGEEDTVLAAIRRGDKVDHFETVRQRKDGSTIPIALTVSPIIDAGGRVVGASKIARDISERLRLEADRAHALALAEEASRLKDQFIATLSHELRTPLNAILGYARMMRSGIVPAARQPKAVDTIERNATSLARIVEDVLDVSRIISGKMRLNVQPVDMADVVHMAVAGVMPAADAKGIRIEESLDREASVSGDPERLQQVVWNLMSNAVRFTGEGGRVSVRLERSGSHAELTVSDTGIGIPRAFLPHVFEPFRQADASMSRERGGLGLGLNITRQLVEMHGGTIAVSSEGEGKGSTVRVALPLGVQAPAATPLADRAAGLLGGAEVPDLHGIRVLAVDDDADASGMLRDILQAAGADVEIASSAQQTLDVIGGILPDVLVADIGMPKMDGFELIERIRTNTNAAVRNIPAAALTAYARSEDRIRALRSGFQVHLSKPIDPAELMSTVAKLAKR